MIQHSAVLVFDSRIMHFGKVGGYRVQATRRGFPLGVYVVAGKYLCIPVTAADAQWLHRGTICNPTKLVKRYLEDQRNERAHRSGCRYVA